MEFFTFEDEVWYKASNGQSGRLTEHSTDIIESLLCKIEAFYPKAYSALSQEYARCKPNIWYFRYRIVIRFLKCNFGNIDNIQDIDKSGTFNFECVPCPLRGECRYENIICHPQFDHRISAAEMRVLRLLYNGSKQSDIADTLYLSEHTVHNHIRNAFVRLGIHSKSEFIKFADRNNLFR